MVILILAFRNDEINDMISQAQFTVFHVIKLFFIILIMNAVYKRGGEN